MPAPPKPQAKAGGRPIPYAHMLKGSKPGLVKTIQPVSIHGQISLDVYFTDPGDPDGQVSLARLGPEAVPKDLKPGDEVDLYYLLGVVTRIVRRKAEG